MAITQLEYCTAQTNVISSLADKPNAQSGMTAAQLKAKFDAADAAIKAYINDTLVPYVNETLGAAIGAAAEDVGDGAVTESKLATSAVTADKIANSAVTSAKIGAGAVGTAKLADGSITTEKLASSLVVPIANGGTGNTTGLAASATKLATAQVLRTNLSKVTAAYFDGTTNASIGVSGILPIDYGGTGASTAGNALANLGGISITKLWENASPTSAFAAQTISLDLSGYDFVDIVYYGRTGPNDALSANGYYTARCPVGEFGSLQVATLIGGTASYHWISCRAFEVTTSGIEFGYGRYIYFSYTTAGDNGGYSETTNIPYRIYGIKGVK